MTRAAIALVLVLSGCALFKSAARTAIDVAREACDVFLSEQQGPDKALGMTLDECADTLLALQQQRVALRRAEMGGKP